MSKKQRTTLTILITVLAVILVTSPIWAAPDSQTSTRFRSIFVSGNADIDGDIDVDGTSNLDTVDIDGDIDVDGTSNLDTVDIDGATDMAGAVSIASTLNVTGNATLSADLVVDDTLNIDDTDSLLTGSQTITPTYSFLQVSPTAVLTLTIATGAAADGDLLIIHNTVTTSTVIIDTGATEGGGNISLGQDDIAAFIFGDGIWVELFSPNNS